MICTTVSTFNTLSQGEDIAVFDIESKGTAYFKDALLMGVGLYFPNKDTSCYIPINIYNREDDLLIPAGNIELKQKLIEYLKSTKLICHNGNFDCGWFSYLGIKLKPYWDTRIAWQLLSPEVYKETNAYSLEKAIEVTLDKSAHKNTFDEYLKSIGASANNGEHYKADTEKLAEYCEEDCKSTYEIYAVQKAKIEDLKAYNFMVNLFEYQEQLWKQYWNGITFDEEKATKYDKLLERYISILNKKIYQYGKAEITQIEDKLTNKFAAKYKTEKGKEKFLNDTSRRIKFNLNSRQHMGELLHLLDIDITELTETGKTKTDKFTLNKYASTNPVINLLVKLNNVQTNRKFIKQYQDKTIDGKYHPDMDICGTASGRLTCFKPNILAVNRRDKRLMSCFVAPKGYKFVQWDLSNIEPRIEAHFAQDKELADIVLTGKDIYLELLRYIYPDKLSQYDPTDLEGSKKRLYKERDMLKRIRLAMGYGAQPKKIALILNIPLQEAIRIYKAYWTARQASKNLENRLLTMYGRNGYIQNMWQRPITMAYSKDILNRFIQSSAHDTLMQINLMLNKTLDNNNIDYKPAILDFHDENITAVKEEQIYEYKEILHKVFEKMNNRLNLLAPLDYDCKIVNNFSELK